MSRLTATTTLKHFAIVTYLVDPDLLRRMIPVILDIRTILQDGKTFGLVSAVTFIDTDFRFQQLAFFEWQFPQTNYRAYVINKTTGKDCVWFFATTLGSTLAYIPQIIWKMPWYSAIYKMGFNKHENIPTFDVEIESARYAATTSISEDKQTAFSTEGFDNIEQARLILTHPVQGFFERSDGKIGHYSVSHPPMEVKTGICNHAYFQLFARLGLLTAEQMKHPYSILLSCEIDFKIYLPPKIYNF